MTVTTNDARSQEHRQPRDDAPDPFERWLAEQSRPAISFRTDDDRQPQDDGKPRVRDKRKRAKRYVENDSFAGFVRRIIRAMGRRVAGGDVESIRTMVDLAAELETAITAGVAGLRREGYSWSEIGARLNISKQAAHKRWASDVEDIQ